MRHQKYPEKQRQESETKSKIYSNERSTKEPCIKMITETMLVIGKLSKCASIGKQNSKL